MKNTQIREEALKYINLGFSVIPLGPITKDADGKKVIEYPKGGWKKYQEKIASPEEVAEWECENLGIVTGRISNLLVLDTDNYKENYDAELVRSFHISEAPVQETASKGRQYFFRLPKGKVFKNSVNIGHSDSGVDVRCEGGMVIVDPSVTPYGSYEWVIDPFTVPPPDIPPVLLDLLTKESEENKSRKSITEIVGINEGGRNNTMASLVGRLLASTPIDKWDSEVWSVAQAVNQTYKPPMANEELQSIYHSIKRAEMRNRQGSPTTAIKSEEPKIYIPAISHAELISKEFPLARFTIEPFFEQGTMNMVSAPPNTWKSWLLFLFANNIATGTAVLDKFATEKAGVMIVNEEDSPRLVQDRLKLLDINESNLPIFYRIAQGAKLKEDFVKDLIAEAKEKNVGVIMFDSLRAIHEADENDSTAMQGVLDQLKKIVREDITVIFTHHHRKKAMFGDKNNDAESTRGSSAINAAISGHISLEEKENKTEGFKYLIVRHLKSKVSEKISPFEIRIEAGDTVGFEYLGEHEEQNKVENEAKEQILSVLEDNDRLMSRKDFVSMKVAGDSTIKKATKALVHEGVINSMSRKEAEKLGLKSLSKGKSNELLYSLKPIDKELVSALPEIEGEVQLPVDW